MINFKDLKEKEFYVVKMFNKYDDFDGKKPFLGIAQLTRIDICDTCDYDVYHFKHNHYEYFYYDYYKSGRLEKFDYRNTVFEVVEVQTGSEKHPYYHNTRVKLDSLVKDKEGNYLDTYVL